MPKTLSAKLVTHGTRLHEGVTPHQTYPGQAHFAGTGPQGARCETCMFLANRRGLNASCSKFASLMQRIGPRFPVEAFACRHYETRIK